MTKANSSNRPPSRKPTKPAKPYEGFPLFAHATGYWAKKVRGRLVYFGPWADPDAALSRYESQKADLHAGRTPRFESGAATVYILCGRFLGAKKNLRDTGEIHRRTYGEYEGVAKMLIRAFGRNRLAEDIGPDDFAALRKRMAGNWGPHRLAKMIQYTRSVFKFGIEDGLLAKPVRFGPGFDRPTKKTFRLHRAAQGPKLFTAEEIRKLIAAASPTIGTMVHLGINCGFGNTDCGRLTFAALDLDRGWVDFARPKTGIMRRCPLWPETVKAIRQAIAVRPAPKDKADAGLVFITKYGGSWASENDPGVISKEFAKLLRDLGINGRQGLGYYALRHTFRTVADEARDQPAADHIMGHESAHMSATYREGIADERLKAVSDYVRAWLFGKPKQRK